MALTTECKNLLCDEKITDESAFRSWAKINHPDKGGNEAKFQSVSACKSNGFCPPKLSLRSARSARSGRLSESARSARSARLAREAYHLDSLQNSQRELTKLQKLITEHEKDKFWGQNAVLATPVAASARTMVRQGRELPSARILPKPKDTPEPKDADDYKAGGKGTRRHYYNYKKTRKGRVNKIYSKKRKTLRRKKYKKN